MRVRVECYAGRKADERLVRFWFDEQERVVEEVLDQWYGPQAVFFKVRADDSIVYVLRHDTSVADGPWRLVAFGDSKGLRCSRLPLGEIKPADWGWYTARLA